MSERWRARRTSSSLIAIAVWGTGTWVNFQIRELMVFITTGREAGGSTARVVARAAARSSTRSLVARLLCCSLPCSNQKATAIFDKVTAAAVTAINCTARVLGQNL